MVIWITGLSGAGKTTLARALRERLKPTRPETILLDGDLIRNAFSNDLDYREESRRIQIGRIQHLARYLAEQDMLVIVAALYAHPELLRWNREHLRDYFEVYIDAPLDLVKSRDRKGLYRKALSGETPNVVGIDIPWHAPDRPDLVINASKPEIPEALAARVIIANPYLSPSGKAR